MNHEHLWNGPLTFLLGNRQKFTDFMRALRWTPRNSEVTVTQRNGYKDFILTYLLARMIGSRGTPAARLLCYCKPSPIIDGRQIQLPPNFDLNDLQSLTDWGIEILWLNLQEKSLHRLLQRPWLGLH